MVVCLYIFSAALCLSLVVIFPVFYLLSWYYFLFFLFRFLQGTDLLSALSEWTCLLAPWHFASMLVFNSAPFTRTPYSAPTSIRIQDSSWGTVAPHYWINQDVFCFFFHQIAKWGKHSSPCKYPVISPWTHFFFLALMHIVAMAINPQLI